MALHFKVNHLIYTFAIVAFFEDHLIPENLWLSLNKCLLQESQLDAAVRSSL